MYGSVSFALARAKLFITRAEYFRGRRAKSTRVVSGADAVWCADRNDKGHGRHFRTTRDVLVLEEAAYCDEGFFYETVAFFVVSDIF